MEKEKKAKTEQIIVVFLLVVFALVLANSFKRMGFLGSKQSSAPVVDAIEGTIPEIIKKASDQVELNTNVQEQESIKHGESYNPNVPVYEYVVSDKRSPFDDLFPKPESPAPEPVQVEEEEVVPVAETPRLPDLVLGGTIWGGARPQAIINGEVYDVGDSVDGCLIKSIDRSGVTLDYSGYVVTISESKSEN